jgi:asparagine synthase (glutamine-hydrolysing)
MREPYNRVPDAATLDRMLYLDWKFTLADNDLRKVTRTCNSAGVDVSFPWLDDDVIEFSTRLPAAWKMRGTKLRYFVKDALTPFLPSATITKSKHGFGLPFGQWLKTSPTLQARVYELLATLRTRSVFQPAFLDRLIAEHQSGHAAYYGTMVWVLAMLEAWFEANDVNP